MTRAKNATTAVALLAVLLAGGATAPGPRAVAQDAAAEPATRPAAANIEDVAKQRFTKRQFEQLMAKMVELAELLDKAEPQTAKTLRDAVSQAQQAFIAEDMEKVAQYLSNGVAAAAATTQTEVISELQKVLQTLRLGTLDLDARLERIREMEGFRDAIRDLAEKQKPLEQQSNLASNADELARRAGQLGQQLGDIVKQQKELRGKTADLPAPDADVRKLLEIAGKLKDAIERQTTLRSATASAPIDRLPVSGQLQKLLGDRTEGIGKDIDAAAADQKLAARLGAKDDPLKNPLNGASESVAKAVKEMGNASAALGRSDANKAVDPQDQAIYDLQQAAKAVNDALAQLLGGQDDSGALTRKQGELAGKTSDLAAAADKLQKETGLDVGGAKAGGEKQPGEESTGEKQPGEKSGGQKQPGNLDKAAEHMKGAAEKLAEKDRDKALGKQDDALKELESDELKVAKLERRIEQEARKPTEQQARDQGELAERGDKTAKQMESKSDMPGTKEMADASKSMSGASSKLSQGQSGKANADQNDALEKMKKAMQELDEAIAQEKALAQAEQLEKIDQMLQKVLERQRTISAATAEVDGKRKGDSKFDRPEQIKLTGLSGSQGKLAEDVETVRAILDEEGNSVVFSEVLGDVRGDMQDVQKLLDAQDPGQMAQTVQKEIERSLQDMIDAVRKELAERRNKAGGSPPPGGGGGGGGKQPLVPVLAELKMIRTMEIGIQRRTAALNKQVGSNNLPADQAKAEHGKLSRRQEALQKITEELNTKINRGAAGGGDDGGF